MITLYTTYCPKCIILEKKLNAARIDYKIEDNIDIMLELGITSAPMLKIDDKLLNFTQSVDYVNKTIKGL